MWKTILILFLTFATGAFAGPDGYLRYCEPLTLRFGPPALSPPMVNDLILALDHPTEETNAESDGDFSAPPALAGADYFNSALINELITGTSRPTSVVVAGPNVAGASTDPDNYNNIQFPNIPIPTPNEPDTEAQAMAEVVKIFTDRRPGGNRGGGTIIGLPLAIPPTEFTPPQPSGQPPSSRAIYKVE